MLRICGLGIYNKLDADVVALLRGSDIFLERYTFRISDGQLREIEEAIGKRIVELDRGSLEERAGEFVRKASDKDIALLVGGDPLIATTHKILYLEAIGVGVKIEVVHSSSIFTAAIGESGLDFYRFGEVCTIADWKEGYRPVSFYDKLSCNFGNNMHTLILLDYDSVQARSMDHKEALRIMLDAESSKAKGIISREGMLIVMTDIGSDGMRLLYKRVNELLDMDLDYGMCCFILHAELSEIEKEMLGIMCGLRA